MGIFCMFVVIGLLFMFALLLACHKLYRDTEKELQETKDKLLVEKTYSTQWRRKYEDTLE